MPMNKRNTHNRENNSAERKRAISRRRARARTSTSGLSSENQRSGRKVKGNVSHGNFIHQSYIGHNLSESTVRRPKGMLQLYQDLNCYTEPSTGAEDLGVLPQGDYVVLSYRKNHPDENTDFALLQSASVVGRNAWVCTRWQDNIYAEKLDNTKTPETVVTPDTDEQEIADGISESVLIQNLAEYRDFTYDLKDPYYPYEILGVSVPQSPPSYTNCCCFVEGLLVKSWEDALGSSFDWDIDLHKKMMIADADDLFSPVTAVIEAGMATRVDNINALPQAWTLVQGWRDGYSGGHSFLILDTDANSQKVLTLEANSSYSLNGVGYREIGGISNFADLNPGRQWANNDCWTWSKFREYYPNMQMARLKVNNISWVKNG